MSNFLGDNLRVKREDVLVLGAEVHRCDTNAMHVLVLKYFARMSKLGQVLVEDLDCQEVCSG